VLASPIVATAARVEHSRGSAPYLSVGPLAEGGMGSVELVLRREGSFERLYARKRPKEEYRRDPEFRRAFLDEARLAGLLRHPNVVSVLDVGEDADGPYLIMDLVDGFSLATIIGQFRAREDLLPLSVCIAIGKQMAEGLHAAHDLVDHSGKPHPLVHRDISPQNALVDHEGVARVTDFGLAKALGASSDTSSEVLRGKLGYMSPEQLRFQKIDRRSDLFSLGVVIYEMLTTERLYRAATIEEAAQRILNESPPDPTEIRDDVPPSLVALLMDLLCKEPSSRPKDAATVAKELSRIGRECAESEEPLELRDFMTEHFGEERDAVRAVRARAVEAALGGRKSTMTPRREIGEPTARAKPSVLDTRPWVAIELEPSAALRRRPRRAWIYGAIVAVGLGAIAAAAIVSFTGDAPGSESAIAPQHPPPASSATARAPSPEVPASAPIETRVEVEPPPPETRMDAAPASPEPIERTPQRERARVSMRSAAAADEPPDRAPSVESETAPRTRSGLEKRLWRWP
jgi:serine/threonine protein kinase